MALGPGEARLLDILAESDAPGFFGLPRLRRCPSHSPLFCRTPSRLSMGSCSPLVVHPPPSTGQELSSGCAVAMGANGSVQPGVNGSAWAGIAAHEAIAAKVT